MARLEDEEVTVRVKYDTVSNEKVDSVHDSSARLRDALERLQASVDGLDARLTHVKRGTEDDAGLILAIARNSGDSPLNDFIFECIARVQSTTTQVDYIVSRLDI